MHGAVLNYLRLDPLHYRTCGQTSVLTKHLVTERRVFRNAKPYVPLRLGSSIHAPRPTLSAKPVRTGRASWPRPLRDQVITNGLHRGLI